MFLVLWVLLGAVEGAVYQRVRPGRERPATSLARGAVGAVLGGFLVPRFIAESPSLPIFGTLGAVLLAAVAISAMDIDRALRDNVRKWQRSQA